MGKTRVGTQHEAGMLTDFPGLDTDLDMNSLRSSGCSPMLHSASRDNVIDDLQQVSSLPLPQQPFSSIPWGSTMVNNHVRRGSSSVQPSFVRMSIALNGQLKVSIEPLLSNLELSMQENTS